MAMDVKVLLVQRMFSVIFVPISLRWSFDTALTGLELVIQLFPFSSTVIKDGPCHVTFMSFQMMLILNYREEVVFN